MMIYEFKNPIPVITKIGKGMAIYACDSGQFANDVWTIVMENGRVRHFRTDQLMIEKNATWDIGNKSSL
jgi:hypothetical protein